MIFDPLPHVLEEGEGFTFVLHQRVALAVGAQPDSLAKMVQSQKVVLPLTIHRIEQEEPLETSELFVTENGGKHWHQSMSRHVTPGPVKKGDRYLLTGQKRFIVGGLGADFFLVYARTDPDADPKRGIYPNVITVAARPRLRASSTSRASMVRWPRWTPSPS